MSDDVDDLLRHAMATLDRQIPARTFDDLVDRTLARLDESDGPGGIVELARERAARGVASPAMAPSEPTPAAELPRDAGTPLARPAAARRRWKAVLGTGVAVAAAASVVAWLAARPRAGAREPVSAISPAGSPDRTFPRGVVSSTNEGQRQKLADPGTAQLRFSHDEAPRPDDEPGGSGASPATASVPVQLSTAPSAEDVRRAITRVATRAQGCLSGAQTTGPLLVVTVRPSGEIARAELSQPFTGSAVETCMQRAVNPLRFPPWSGSSQVFRFRLKGSEVRAEPGEPAELAAPAEADAPDGPGGVVDRSDRR